MSASNVRTSSAHASSSSLRPRGKRLISGLDEGDETSFDPDHSNLTRIASPLPSPYGSRPASPIPSAHPQRSGTGTPRQYGLGSTRSPVKRGVAGSQRTTRDSSPSLAGLWGSSWSTLQGLASDFLGSDLAATDTTNRHRSRRTQGKLHSVRSQSTNPQSSSWGPSAPTSHPQSSSIGSGTREEQAAALRAQKRMDMLTRQESSYATTDAMGKFKRRLSDDRNSVSAPPGGEEDREALVYVHHVTKNDTLAGITIRYNISANALRKANRMWPNDTVQTRQILILPVDACGVKGKPTSDGLDLLGAESESLSSMQAEEVPTPTQAQPNPGLLTTGRDRSQSTSTHSHAGSSVDTEANWHHDSWVLLPGNTKPTEIARLPRRALGYFPPARRKSNAWSDAETPSTSLDLNRNTSDAGHPPPSPSRQNRPPHTRRPSNANNGYFPSYLSGPGGVGTMSQSVRCPGPAQDSLNKIFAKHLPDVAPPRNQQSLYHPEVPLYTDEPTPLTSGSHTPAYPHGGGGTGGMHMNLENVGGAIESWVRRLATKSVTTPSAERRAARASVGTPGKGAGGVGDLIEMTDEFEIGGEDDDLDELGRGRQGSVGVDGQAGGGSSGASYFDGATAVSRGRGGKSGKAD
ncbi:unnamed protein product [Zymoseptoria tritici ST99CH_3D1]|nr:unnamed protein product [Zymoseptoria tritici ST99CH_3D1]